MAALAIGFRETFEAAAIIAALLAVAGRLNHAELRKGLYCGLGAALAISFAVGTGLQAARVPLLGLALEFQPFAFVLAAVSMAGLGICLWLNGGDTAVGWIAASAAFWVALPQALETVGWLLTISKPLQDLIGVALGMAGALLVAFFVYEGLTHLRALRGATRPLAAVKVRRDS